MLTFILGLALSVLIFGIIGLKKDASGKWSWGFQKKQFAALGVLVLVLVLCVGFIPVNHVGIQYNVLKGDVNPTVLEQGAYVKSPVTKIYKYTTQIQSTVVKNVFVQDGDRAVYIDVDVQYIVPRLQVFSIFEQFKTEWNLKRVLIPVAVQHSMALVTENGINDLTKRLDVQLAEDLVFNNVELFNVNIVAITMSDNTDSDLVKFE
jgi:hypothetical protein